MAKILHGAMGARPRGVLRQQNKGPPEGGPIYSTTYLASN